MRRAFASRIIPSAPSESKQWSASAIEPATSVKFNVAKKPYLPRVILDHFGHVFVDFTSPGSADRRVPQVDSRRRDRQDCRSDPFAVHHRQMAVGSPWNHLCPGRHPGAVDPLAPRRRAGPFWTPASLRGLSRLLTARTRVIGSSPNSLSPSRARHPRNASQHEQRQNAGSGDSSGLRRRHRRQILRVDCGPRTGTLSR